MSEENAPNPSPLIQKVEDEKIDIHSLPEMSADEIDSMIQENDPEFVQALSKIGADKSLTIEQIIIDDIDAAFHAELDLWVNAKGFKKVLYQIFPFIAKVSFKFKLLKFRFYAWFVGRIVIAKNFLYFLATEGRKQFFSFLIEKKKKTFEKLSKIYEQFKKLSIQAKLILFFSLGLSTAAVFVLYLAVLNKGFLPEDGQLFVVNLSNNAHARYSYNPETEVEPYIDNARATQNLILIQKMVVNLKPSQNSGRNPMMAAEFFIEGMSADVVVEIKDREIMIRDLMQRTLEEMPYDLVESVEGKREMLSRLQKEISRILTTGRVKNVRIKTIVIKP